MNLSKLQSRMSIRSARAERYIDAERNLQEAGNRIAEADSDDLKKQIERARQDVKFAQALAGVAARMEYPRPVEGYFVVVTAPRVWADGFAKTFAEWGYDVNGDPDELAKRIRASRLPEQTIAGLDQWALAAYLLNERALQQKLLQIARLGDREPTWRNRFHDPAVWSDELALLKLAKESLKTSTPTANQLAITGALLRSHGAAEEEAILLEQAVLLRPGDYLLRWELARALRAQPPPSGIGCSSARRDRHLATVVLGRKSPGCRAVPGWQRRRVQRRNRTLSPGADAGAGKPNYSLQPCHCLVAKRTV